MHSYRLEQQTQQLRSSLNAFTEDRSYRQNQRETSSGTCDITLQVDGVNVPGFTAVGASSTPVEQNLANSITVDAQTANASKTIGFEASNVTSAADIEIVLAVTKVAS